MASRMQALEEFPSSALLPKGETQVESFLRKYPEYNGDNVLIAIFDTGVDPGAHGLRVTPSGKRKLIDSIDCTGCGDVDTSTIETVAEDGTITGKSGTKLTIPQSWNNPTGQYRIGIKSAYSLFPGGACKRVQREKKEEEWDNIHKSKLAEAVGKLAEFDIKCPSPTTEAEKLEHEDLSAAVESLKLLEKNHKDKGPFFDCILFHDGEMWRACIDTTEEGRLEECTVLGPYNLTGQFGQIGKKDMVNYTVNVYEDGNRLSIVTNSGAHGTHVACIAAANFEDEPELNGLAPGAQLISMQIGDNRLGSMETGTAFIRAMKCAIDNKVDIINMSFGESSKWCGGRMFDIIHKMVTEHGIIFVSSAGNDGPALSTVGAPVALTNDIIGVGAYVSPEMRVAEYSLIEKAPGTQYTWSSNGPCADGKLGVCIVAPGGAITSVPNWTLSRGQLMNGTSMSSPNACGSIAVLISALKYENIEYSPSSIRTCLENTAMKIDGLSAFVQGQGMVQIDKAFDHMKDSSQDQYRKILTFKVAHGRKSGIYVREDADRLAPEKYEVSVQPVFHKKTDNSLKIQFNKKIALASTESWISCPSHVEMNNGTRYISVIIKKSSLRPGCHYGEVQGFDLNCPNLGPIFRLPITVIVPEVNNGNNLNLGVVPYKQGERKRWFYSVPQGATWAKLSLKSCDKENRDVRYCVHVVQLVPESAHSDHEYKKYISLNPNQGTTELFFKVKSGYTMELNISRWWTLCGDSEISTQLDFHGLIPDHQEITLNGAKAFSRVNVTNHFGEEKLSPSASLTHHVIPLAPKENTIRPLSDRDMLPDGEQIYSLELTYNFHLASSCEVTAVVPSLIDVLYESQVESQFWMIYDANKSLCGYGDVFQMRMKYFCQLEKGDYVVKLQIRQSDFQLLERLKDTILNIYITLATPIVVDVYSSRANIFEVDKKKMFPLAHLGRSDSSPVYFTMPPEDKFPKGIKPGDHFLGKVSFTSDDSGKKVCTYPLTVSLPPTKIPSDGKKESETKQADEEYQDAHQEFLATWIAKLDGFDLQKELMDGNEDSTALNNALLNALDGSKMRTTNLEKIVVTAQKILQNIDQKEMLSYLGMKVDPSEKATKKKKEMEKQKSIFINALYKMALAVSDGILAQRKNASNDESEGDKSPFLIEDLDNCYREFVKVVDATDSKMLMLIVRHGMVHNQYGRAIKALMKYFEGNIATKALYEVYIQLAQSCNWEHVANNLRHTYQSKFPPSYELF